MARCDVRLPNAAIDALGRLGQAEDEIAAEALKAGARVVEPVMRSNLAAVVGHGTKQKPRSTGQLLGALGTSPVKVGRKGEHNIKVGFADNRTDSRPNALIANVLEYGRSNQPAKPFLAPTKRQTRKHALEAVKQALATGIRKYQP